MSGGHFDTSGYLSLSQIEVAAALAES